MGAQHTRAKRVCGAWRGFHLPLERVESRHELRSDDDLLLDGLVGVSEPSEELEDDGERWASERRAPRSLTLLLAPTRRELAHEVGCRHLDETTPEGDLLEWRGLPRLR